MDASGRTWRIALLWAASLAVGGVVAGPAAADEDPALRLLFSGDVRGAFEGCDCADQPLGGLAQRAFVVGDARRSGDAVVVLDAGNLLFRSPMALGSDAESWRRTDALLLVDAYGVMGADAVNVGPHDLASGLDYLTKIQRRAAFPLLSTNLVDGEGGQPVLTPWLVVDRSGVRAAVLGVLPGGMEGQGYVTRDPVAALREAIAAVRDQGVELVIVLSTLGLDDEQQLARKVKGIDLILGSGDPPRTEPPVRVRDTLIVHAGSRGKYLGEVVIGAGRGAGRFDTTIVPVDSGGPVDEIVDELVGETLLRRGAPMFREAGAEARP